MAAQPKHADQPRQPAHSAQPQRLPLPAAQAAQVLTDTSQAMTRWAQRRWAWWVHRNADVRLPAADAGATGQPDVDAPPVLFSLDGPVARVSLNRPARRNALNLACWNALAEIATQLAVDHSVRVVIIGGSQPGTFSAGSDISEFPHARLGADAARRYNEVYDGALAAWSALPQTVIAHIDGFCLGAALELALTADLRLASDTSRFGIPAVKLGIGISVADARRVIDAVGPARARALLLTGETIDASRAHEIGLIDEVHPAADLPARVDALTQILLANAPRSMAWMKQVVDFANRHPDQSAIPFDVLGINVFDTEDTAEGVAAFLNRRSPAFRGA
ncbi:MAG TPA: enoyl-CoA hydratase-related protein [Chloroflexota bacterium]|nr:enoyl-CoA hydratase-related protein [Chloroflexota bacterium]